MIAASSLAFPGTKTVAAWWRQLAPFRPAAIWLGHLFVHRLEALAEVVHFESVDSLRLLLLKTLALEDPSAISNLLPFGPDVLGRLLGDLRTEGLLQKEEGGRRKEEEKHVDSSHIFPPSSFRLSELGRTALEAGKYPRPLWQRREFVFAERLLPDGQRSQPPHFLPLVGGTGAAWQPVEGSRFELDWLRQCPAQHGTWKERFGFPSDVRTIAVPAASSKDSLTAEEPGSPPAWQRVPVDRPERLLIALISVASSQQSLERLLAFSARQEGWELQADKPILDMPGSVRQDLPELAPACDSAQWAKVWRAWCQVRNIPAVEVQECALQANGCRLTIQAPESLHRRLAAAKSDLLKGDGWLVSDEGYLRSAMQVQLTGTR